MRKVNRQKRINTRFLSAAVLLLSLHSIIFSQEKDENNPESASLFMAVEREPDVGKAIVMLEDALPAISLKAERYRILSMLGGLYELNGNAEAAQRSYELAAFVRERQNDFVAFYKSAVLLFTMGDTGRSELQAKTILATSGDDNLNRKVRFLLLRIAAMRSKKADFESQYNQIRKLEADSPFSPSELYSLYESLILEGKEKEAFETGEKLTKLFPDSLEARLFSGETGDGTVKFYPEPMKYLDTPPAAEIKTESYDVPELLIQTGLFSRETNALEMAESLREKNFESSVQPISRDGRQYFKVVVIIRSQEERQHTILKLKDAGYEAF